MAEYIDYDYKPENSGGGKFLNLKAKGDKAVVRLASKPIAYFVHWVDNQNTPCADQESCEICKRINALPADEQKKQDVQKQKRRQTFIWSVIDRADGEAKIFKGGINIFLAIAEYANNADWGGAERDATKFDLEITRTEASLQNFYSVVAKPASLSVPLTDEEKDAVAKLQPLVDSIVTMAEESKELDHAPAELDTPEPSTSNPSSPEDFIKSLEADKPKEE